MNVPCPTTIGEIIWYVLLGIVALVFAELRWAIHRFMNKIDEIPDKYVTKDYMDKWEVGRDGPGGLWHVVNTHSHKGIEGKGEVIR